MENEVTSITITSILSTLGEIFTAAIGYVGDVAEAITGQPLLLLFVLIPLVGLGIGIFKRLLNVN